MYKYLKYKQKYLYYGGFDCIKLPRNYNQMIEHLLSNHQLYLSLCKIHENKKYIYEILNKIYNRYNIKNFLYINTFKFVYNTYNENIVFKIIILLNEQLNRILTELYFMLKYPLYCNKPFDIIVYTKSKIKENLDKSLSSFFKIKNNVKLNKSGIITWKEEKADLLKESDLDKTQSFKDNFSRYCSDHIEKYDIQNLDIKKFSKEPYYRIEDLRARGNIFLDIFIKN